jgi:serine/threonine protein kinase
LSVSVLPQAQDTHIRRFGRYALVELIGRGGMAEVWKAYVSGAGGFQRKLVVKRILPHLARDQSFVKMFLSEARLSARLSHPNIVHVYDLGEESGEYFMAMEYVDGQSLTGILRSLIRQQRQVPVGFAVAVVRDVCRALGYAHALVDEQFRPLHLVHRDVSPSNVMVSYDGVVKLFDFGIAKALGGTEDEHTRTGTVKGKFSYMSPQQAEGLPIDRRADLFAVGVVLHEMLTSRRLFKGENDLQTIQKVKTLAVPPPSMLNPQVPSALDAICLKALERDPEQRYQYAEHLADQLDSVAAELGWNASSVATLMRGLFPALSLAPPMTEPAVVSSVATRAAGSWRDQAMDSNRTELLLATTVDGPALEQTTDSTDREPILPILIQPTHRGRLWLGIASAAALSMALTGAVAVRQPRPAAAASTPSTPVEPAVPVTVDISVETVPSGCELLVDGERRGTTPTVLHLPRSSQPMRLQLTAPGLVPYETLIRPDEAQRLHLTLQPLPNVATAPPPRSTDRLPVRVRRAKARVLAHPAEPSAEPASSSIDADSPTF